MGLLDLMEMLVLQDHKVLQDKEDHLGQLVILEDPVLRVHQVQLGHQGLLVYLELLEFKDQLDLKDPSGFKGLLEPEETLAQSAQQGF